MRTVLLPLLALPLVGYCQTGESEVFFGGAHAGANKATRSRDGLVSETEFNVAGQKVKSSLSIVFDKGVPNQISFEESQGSKSGKYVLLGGKLTTYADGKEVRKGAPYTFGSKALFSTFHPSVVATIYNGWRAQNEPAKMKVTDLSSLTTFETEVTVTSQTVQVESGPKSIKLMQLRVTGIELQYAIDGDEVVGFKVPAQLFEIVRKGYAGVFIDPLSKFPELSQPTFKTKTLKVVQTPMRDGIVLVSELRMPEGEGKYPTILIRTPYGKSASAAQYDYLAKRGYVVMSQDVRGRGGSAGRWDPFNSEVNDGYDTLEWISKQPWSNGNVGMIGGSYLGYVQWAAAVTHHPALKCIIPQVSPPDPLHNVPWDHGCFLLMGNVWWSRIVMEKNANMAAAGEGFEDTDVFKRMPISKVDNALFKTNISFYDAWLSRTAISDWAGAFRMDQIASVKIPVLHISGVWDGDGIGTMSHYNIQKEANGDQWLIFGPWEHGFNVKTKFADQDYGPNAVLELDSTYLRFFDTFLKQKPVMLDSSPRVRFFVTGCNKWYEGDAWPPAEAQTQTMYLGGGSQYGAKLKGTLQTNLGTASTDSYTYNPKAIHAPKSIEINGDSNKLTASPNEFARGGLWYATAPFKNATVIGGPLKAELYFKTTVRDAALYVMVFDVDEKGRAALTGLPGAMRVGFSPNGIRKLTPNAVYRVSIEPWLFAREFKPGHKLAIAILSDLFPKYARIPGTGEPDSTATRLLVAKHTILKGKSHPSKITFYAFAPSVLKG